MRALGSEPNYKRIKLTVHMHLTVAVIKILVFSVISLLIYRNMYEWGALIFIFASYFLVNTSFSIVLSLYFFFLLSIKSRYHSLNECFRLVFNAIQSSKLTSHSFVNKQQTIDRDKDKDCSNFKEGHIR